MPRTSTQFREALLIGLLGGAGFALAMPVALLLGWGFLAYWVGSAMYLRRQPLKYPVLTLMIPSATAAAVCVGLLYVAGVFGDMSLFSGDEIGVDGWFGYLTLAGWLFSLPLAFITPSKRHRYRV